MSDEPGELLDASLISGETPALRLLPVHERFEARAAETPGRVALIVDGQEVTYAALDARANRIAHAILAHTRGERRNIGVLLGRSADLIPSLLAVLKAGCTCVPLATEYPATKVAFMLQSSRSALVVTTSALQATAPEEIEALCLDRLEAELPTLSAEPPGIATALEDVAYILYTSGTSGSPKGVMIHHAGMDNHLLWRRDFYAVGPDDVFLHKSPIGFDVALWEIHLPLSVGARVVLAPPAGQALLPQLIRSIITHHVSVVQFVGSLLRQFLQFKAAAQCTSLRLIKCGGEAWSFDLVARCAEILPGAQLANGYGPTEASLGVSAWKCDPSYEYGCLVIGKPVYNSAFLILDDARRPVAPGASGELYIGGEAVSPGYWDNPELTAEKFVSLPCRAHLGRRFYRSGDIVKLLPDGNITFQGRRDSQIKVNGVRVELEEIEEIIGAYPGVSQAGVVCREQPDGAKELHAFVAVKTPPDAASLTEFCAARLPPGILPRRWTPIDEMPVTANGKIDRAALLRLSVAKQGD